MFISPIRNVNFNSNKKQNVSNTREFINQNYATDIVSFNGLMPNTVKKGIKMCVFDLDETLLEGTQKIRNRVMAFSKRNDRVLVYSSARPIGKVKPLIENGTLKMPDWCVCNNGVNIYKNINGTLEEVTAWSKELIKNFDKTKIRDVMLGISKKYMFTDAQRANMPARTLPASHPEFDASSIAEYESFGEDSNIRFMMMPGTYNKVIDEFTEKINQMGIKSDIICQVYTKNQLIPGFLEKYFSFEISQKIRECHFPRQDEQGNVEVLIASAKTDKGRATEYIRDILKLEPKQIFAVGDAENDFSHTNKDYFFGLISNATVGLRELMVKNIENYPKRIIETSQPGVDGIYEIIRP